jgi:hypothetical protein
LSLVLTASATGEVRAGEHHDEGEREIDGGVVAGEGKRVVLRRGDSG